MANYASLWTSGSDKEFRQLSKLHSLQRRRLGLQMAGIQREHAQQVKRVRVEIREAGTLMKQYEDEKEQRARHLLRTFSKVQKRRQAGQNWRTAHQQHRSSSSSPSVAAPSVTFDVEIGGDKAPWGGGAARRRDSQQSNSSRRSSTASLKSVATSPRPSLPSLLPGGKTVTISPHLPRHRDTTTTSGGLSNNKLLSLPPLLSRGHQAEGGQHQGRKGSSRFPKLWRPAALGHGEKRSKEENEQQDAFIEDEDDYYGELAEDQRAAGFFRGKGSRKGSGPLANYKRAAAGQPMERQVLWTQTFPYVYHSVGEAVCPRYKLFLQYDEYKIGPLQAGKARRKRSSVRSTASLASQYPDAAAAAVAARGQTVHAGRRDHRPSLRTVGRTVEVLSIFKGLSLGQPADVISADDPRPSS